MCVEHTPVLSSNFESSVPGLYFVGASAANTFGPLLRFAYGAGFTARRLSRHLAKSADRKSVLGEPKSNVEAKDRDEMAVRHANPVTQALGFHNPKVDHCCWRRGR